MDPTVGTRPRASVESMKIYFCDVCNESIPLKDINANRISIEDGKIICPKCAPKKARRREPLPAGLLASLGVLFLALLGLVVLGSVVAIQHEERLGEISGSLDDLHGRLTAMQGTQQDNVAGVEALRKGMDALEIRNRERWKTLEAGLAKLDERESGASKDLRERLDSGLTELQETLPPRIDDVAGTVKGVQERLSVMEVQQDGLEKQIELVRDLLTSDRPAGPDEAVAEGAPSAGDGEAGEPGKPGEDVESLAEEEVDALIAELESSNYGTRYSATVELGRYDGPKVVAALERMVSDPEDFIRKTAIRILRDKKSKGSIPLFLDALQDEDYHVRVAASGALQALTGQKFGYNPDAPPKEREQQASRWRSWWNENKKRVLASGDDS